MDYYADQNLRMANRMLEQQGEINRLRSAADLARRCLTSALEQFRAAEPDVAVAYAGVHQAHEVLEEVLG